MFLSFTGNSLCSVLPHTSHSKKSGPVPASLLCKSWFHVSGDIWIASLRPLAWPATAAARTMYEPTLQSGWRQVQDHHLLLEHTFALQGRFAKLQIWASTRGWILLLPWLTPSLSTSPEVTQDYFLVFRNITVLRSLPEEGPHKHSLLQTTQAAQINLFYTGRRIAGLLQHLPNTSASCSLPCKSLFTGAPLLIHCQVLTGDEGSCLAEPAASSSPREVWWSSPWSTSQSSCKEKELKSTLPNLLSHNF